MKILDYLCISTQNYWKFQFYIFSRFQDIANIQLLFFFTNKANFLVISLEDIHWKHSNQILSSFYWTQYSNAI